jgi:CheY-like chemotaxis protein
MWTGAPAIFRIHYESGTLIVRSSRAVASAAGRHALIIEDEILIALEVEALLEDLGFDSFDIAESPDEALACAAAHRPDLITADIRIIGGTGIEAVQKITAALGKIPVVYVTGNPDALKGRESAAIVDKPITARALAAACERVCRAA